ncbi:MAG: ABC transporter transmembrane domain-containing protein [Candidatus Omnitrophota bacterium]
MKEYFRLLKFVKPYMGILVTTIVMMGLTTLVSTVANVGLIIPFVTRIIAGKNIEVPPEAGSLVIKLAGYINSFERLNLLYFLIMVVLAAYFLKEIFTYLHELFMNKLSLSVIRDVKNKLYEKLLGLSLSFYSENKAGMLVSRITYDTGVIQNAISEGIKDLIFQSIQLIALLVWLRFILVNFKIPFMLLLGIFIIVPLIVLPIIKIGRHLRKISAMSQEKMADINAILFETFSGIRIVKAFSMEKYEVDKFRKENQSFFKIMIKSAKRIIFVSPLAEFITVVSVSWIMFVGGKAMIEGTLDPGAFFAFLGCISQMITPFKRLSKIHAINQQALAAATRIFEIFDTVPSVSQVKGAIDAAQFSEDIVFQNVWFRYEERDILKDVNLKVKRGEIIAFVGPSGVGKTTLVNLIPRFYDCTKGRILFDGNDIRKVSFDSLRSQIGIVTQETILFNDSIKANIAYGTVLDQSRIEKAAKIANAHDFIINLPLGYDTVVGDRGFKLSGGEKQRLSIARAILKNPPILILDEATSQLDTQSEKMVQEAVNNLIKGRTAFVIAHRLSTIRGAHRIIVINEGRIIEEGTHEQLMGKNGLYRKLYEMQFRL